MAGDVVRLQHGEGDDALRRERSSGPSPSSAQGDHFRLIFCWRGVESYAMLVVGHGGWKAVILVG